MINPSDLRLINTSPENKALLSRIVAKIAVAENGCWIWQGVKQNGYGAIYISQSGKMSRVHRVLYDLCIASVPLGHFVCHDCPGGDNRACCNPAHMFLGTNQDNIIDAGEKGSMSRPNNKNRSRLTPEQVQKIRQQYAESPVRGVYGRLAKEYGITRFAIMKIVKRKTWK